MTISIIIPVYNEEKFIGKCLENICNQTEKADEIIIVDNNSTDDTVKIAKKYPVKIIQEKKQGMIFARNAGFNAATGDILARTDADSLLPLTWIKRVKNYIRKNKLDAVGGPVVFYDLPVNKYNQLLADVFSGKVRLYPSNVINLIGSNMALKNSYWKLIKHEVCLDDKKVHEDLDLSIHLMRKGARMKQIRSLIVPTSGRRIKEDPISFYIDYPIKTIKTLAAHL